jgi:hypothetical protein
MRASNQASEGAFDSSAQTQAGQVQADSMGTGGFLNPPVGEAYDELHKTPRTPTDDFVTPGAIKGITTEAAGALLACSCALLFNGCLFVPFRCPPPFAPSLQLKSAISFWR